MSKTNKKQMNRNNNNRNGYQKGKSRRRGKGKEFEVNLKDTQVNKADIKGIEGPNDPSWYARSEALLKDSASFPYANPAGTRVRLGSSSFISGSNPYTNPGIMVIDWSPVIGVSSTQIDAPTIAANEQYTFLRSNSSGAPSFEAPDLMMYELACDSNCIWFSKLVRLYGTLNLNPVDNRYQPRYLVEAQGFDYDSLIGQLANLRYQINHYAFQLGRLCVPNDITLITRHAFMENNVYLDSETSKSQMYLYNSIGGYVYREKDEGKPGYLHYMTWREMALNGATDSPLRESKLMNLDDIINVCNALFLPIMLSEDFDEVASYIRKAYGMDKLIKFATVGENYLVEPKYEKEILMQIENAQAWGMPLISSGLLSTDDSYSWDITQNADIESSGAGSIIQQPWVYASNGPAASTVFNGKLPYYQDWTFGYPITNYQLLQLQNVINMHIDNPTPADSMVATRLKSNIGQWYGRRWSTEADGEGTCAIAHIQTCGSEIVHRFRISTILYNQGTFTTSASLGKIDFLTAVGGAIGMTSDITMDGITSSILTMISNFDWHPILYVGNGTNAGFASSSNPIDFMGLCGDIDNIAVIGANQLEKLNDVALYSMMASPTAANGSARF